MKKKFVLSIALALFLVFIDFVTAQYINEVFPNPSGDDNNREFVEIWSAGFVNFSGFVFGDDSGNDTLVALQYAESNYSLIVEEGFSFLSSSGINASVYSTGATIGNNLGNSGDNIFFYTPYGILLDSFSYTSSFVVEGKSIERRGFGAESEWLVGLKENGTPGRENSVLEGYTDTPEQETNTTIPFPSNETQENQTPINQTNESNSINSVKIMSLLPSVAAVNQTITKGFRIDNLGKEKIDAVLHIAAFFEGSNFFQEIRIFENMSRYRTKDTLALAFSKEGNYTVCGTVESNQHEEDFSDNTVCANMTIIDYSSLSCDRNLTIHLNQSIFQNKEAIPFHFVVAGDFEEQELPFVVSYSISEFRGDTVKEERNTTNQDTKRWTPSLRKSYGLFVLSAELKETTCADTHPKNNIAVVQILVENPKQEKGSVTIDHVYLGNDGIAHTGDILRIKVTLYTGNLSGLSSENRKVEIFVKNENDVPVSPITQIAVPESFTEATFMVPIALEYSCKEFPSSEEQYILVAEGLGSSGRQKFPVLGVNKQRCSSSLQGEYSDTAFAAIAFPNEIMTTNITIRNIDGTPHSYKVSSKIYRGPKTYSGNFFANQQEIELLPGEEKQVTLLNTLENMSSGKYKTKIQIQKDQQKTLKEFRGELLILDRETNEGMQENQKKYAIISFQPLTDEPKEEMPLLAQVEGSGNVTLVFDTLFAREEKSLFLNGSTFIFYNATLAQGKNNIILRIVENNTVVASMPLILFAEKEEIQDVSFSENETEEVRPSGMEAITGAVVRPLEGYTTSFYKLSSILNYGLITVLLFFVIFLVFQKAQPI